MFYSPVTANDFSLESAAEAGRSTPGDRLGLRPFENRKPIFISGSNLLNLSPEVLAVERYRPIVDDWDAFVDATSRPPKAAARRNPLKSGEDFEERLEESFAEVEQAGWNPEVYRLGWEESPGKTLMHWRGEYYVQEESAAVPVHVLDPQPGDRVLEMAAAPGGKTTQLAARMENRGTLIANNIYRTGSAALVTSYEGENLPEKERYDRVLLDAPCTAEADRARQDFTAADESSIHGLARLQKMLVEKAYRLLKDGGRLVYSTCTFSPSENEGVVAHALENTPLNPVDVDLDVPHVEGVQEFDGEEFNPAVRKTARIYPHHLDSGGMYVAAFEK